MHDEHERVLERDVRVLDLVVHGRVVLTGDGALATIGVALAALAGFAQLFSP
jgi:hypothetical protein